MQEKRRFIRLDGQLSASYRPINAESDAILDAITRNVSGGGVCLATGQQLTVGSALHVSVVFPGREKAIEFTAAVVWSDPLREAVDAGQGPNFESGLRFMEIDESDRAFITDFSSQSCSS